MMCPHDEEDEGEEVQQQPGDFAQQLQTVRESFESPSPRTQTDLSGAVPRMLWADQPTDELYRPIEDMPDLAYRFYPTNPRALPSANAEPTGLIQDTTYRPADTFANNQPTWVPDYPDSHPTRLVDYDQLEQWLSQHLPAPDQLDVLVIFTDTRPLDKVGAWKHTKRLWQHRFSRLGPSRERWRGLFVPLTAEAGLSEVQCTWGGVFVAEAIAALRPSWHLLLSDTDVAPTALFEVKELVNLCRHLMHEELELGEPGLLIGTEPYQDINAGMAIFIGSNNNTPRPGTPWRKIAAARRALLDKPREDLPGAPAALMPPVTIPERQFRAMQSAMMHASHVRMAALTRTPLAGIKASSSTDFLTAWAILGTWTCVRVWPTPDKARWPQACHPVNRALAERKPYLGGWARSSFEQGALCALAAMSSSDSRYCAIPGDACFQRHRVGPCVTEPPQATLPLFIHYYGNKDAIHELGQIRAMPFLCQSLYGHGNIPPFWCQREWRAAADFSVTCSKRPASHWQIPEWETVAPISDETPISPNEVLAVPSTIADGFCPQWLDMPVAAPGGAQTVQDDTAVPGGTEVLHVYATGLNGSLPHNMPAEQSAATFQLREAQHVSNVCRSGWSTVA